MITFCTSAPVKVDYLTDFLKLFFFLGWRPNVAFVVAFVRQPYKLSFHDFGKVIFTKG